MNKYSKKIECILNEGKKCKEKYGNIGPTGPMGPAGSSETITIRNTITSDDGIASVIDVSTNENHILDFIIPKGDKGDIGPTGPAGTSIKILGSYDTLTDLKNEHSTGSVGDGYLVDENLYVWSDTTNDWEDAGKIKGPKGDAGEIGPTGATGPSFIKTAYLATFNDNTEVAQGIIINPNERIPIEREELNINNLVTLNSENTLKFNLVGYYKISIIVSGYPEFVNNDFDPETDFISYGFREVETDNIYIGASQWIYDDVATETYAQGIISVNDISKLYELVSLSKGPIYLNSPNLEYISSKSYFTNALVNIIIEYLGR